MVTRCCHVPIVLVKNTSTCYHARNNSSPSVFLSIYTIISCPLLYPLIGPLSLSCPFYIKYQPKYRNKKMFSVNWSQGLRFDDVYEVINSNS